MKHILFGITREYFHVSKMESSKLNNDLAETPSWLLDPEASEILFYYTPLIALNTSAFAFFFLVSPPAPQNLHIIAPNL
jgi:hypothetical protein